MAKQGTAIVFVTSPQHDSSPNIGRQQWAACTTFWAEHQLVVAFVGPDLARKSEAIAWISVWAACAWRAQARVLPASFFCSIKASAQVWRPCEVSQQLRKVIGRPQPVPRRSRSTPSAHSLFGTITAGAAQSLAGSCQATSPALGLRSLENICTLLAASCLQPLS